MRNYVPQDDEPTGFDVFYDTPAEGVKGIPFRTYLKIERNPERAKYLERLQNEAILDMLRWAYDNRAELRAKGHTLPESWPE